jgi:hypothetical protein
LSQKRLRNFVRAVRSLAALEKSKIEIALGIRTGQIKRFLSSPSGSSDEITVLLSKVSSQDIKSFVEKLGELDGVTTVNVTERKRGDNL